VSGYPELDRFLRADPRDAGCAQAKEILRGDAELVAAGEPPAAGAHLCRYMSSFVDREE
jgi:hypothetical protein